MKSPPESVFWRTSPGRARSLQLLAQPLRRWLRGRVNDDRQYHNKPTLWRTHRVLDRAMDITAAQLIRLRLQLHAPDLMLAPDVRRIGTLEFYRGKEAIAAGRAVATAWLPEIRELLRVSAERESRKLSDVS